MRFNIVKSTVLAQIFRIIAGVPLPESNTDEIEAEIALANLANDFYRLGSEIIALSNSSGNNLLQISSPNDVTYYGGPLLENVEVTVIFYGSVQYQQELISFYKWITKSPYMVALGQYSTENYTIGYGSFYNNSDENGLIVPYSIIPDQSGTCNGVCGGSNTVLENLQSVSSHEFIESITDPGIGVTTSYGPPLGWYNGAIGEIADICNSIQETYTDGSGTVWTVEKFWSNEFEEYFHYNEYDNKHNNDKNDNNTDYNDADNNNTNYKYINNNNENNNDENSDDTDNNYVNNDDTNNNYVSSKEHQHINSE
ncbi:hypothetical protein HK100_010686 [Physocladia obscura]|uniref:Uncharacterized protein n=1 Tax=Physocladia obscura TaxID=109957 RepID=A0AAD5TCP4_9FUNG|nr:hypothetical protein HK100_010686 [Physocladia obscura]